MSDIQEVDNAVKILKNNLSILHCNSAYPTPINDLNLNVISFFKKIQVCQDWFFRSFNRIRSRHYSCCDWASY